MTRLKKKDTNKIQEQADAVFEEFESILKKHKLDGFRLMEFKIVPKDETELNCDCGKERITLSSGKVVIRCKVCPPS